eukprot:376529_1
MSIEFLWPWNNENGMSNSIFTLLTIVFFWLTLMLNILFILMNKQTSNLQQNGRTCSAIVTKTKTIGKTQLAAIYYKFDHESQQQTVDRVVKYTENKPVDIQRLVLSYYAEDTSSNGSFLLHTPHAHLSNANITVGDKINVKYDPLNPMINKQQTYLSDDCVIDIPDLYCSIIFCVVLFITSLYLCQYSVVVHCSHMPIMPLISLNISHILPIMITWIVFSVMASILIGIGFLIIHYIEKLIVI